MNLRPALCACFACFSPLLLAHGARAQSEELPSAQPPPTTAPVPEVSPDDDGAWRHRYDAARERLLAGSFAEAADQFDALAREARAPVDRSLAESMHDLARSWADRGLALVRRSDLGESALSAKSVNERTTDEIAQLYVNSIFYGVGSGLWLDVHTNPNTAGAAVLPLLLFSGASAGTVALLDIGHPLRYGVPQSIVSGLYVGFEEGLVLSLWNQSQSSSSSRWQGQTVADVIWGLSTVGAVGGGALGTTLGSTPGRASFVGTSALWTGVVVGLLAAGASGSDSDRAPNALLAAGIGLNAGAIGGLLAAGAVSPSIGRVRFLDVGAIGGGLLVGGLYLAGAGRNPDGRAASVLTGLGVAGGLGVAWAATSGMPADRLNEGGGPKPGSVAVEPALVPLPGGAAVSLHGTL
jgi:hypothetical protein